MRRFAFLAVVMTALLATVAYAALFPRLAARRAARLSASLDSSSGATGCSGGVSYPGYTYSPTQLPGGATMWTPQVIPTPTPATSPSSTITEVVSRDCKKCGQTVCFGGVCQIYKCEKGQCNIAEAAQAAGQVAQVTAPEPLAAIAPRSYKVQLTYESGNSQVVTVTTYADGTANVSAVEPMKTVPQPVPRPTYYRQPVYSGFSSGGCSTGSCR